MNAPAIQAVDDALDSRARVPVLDGLRGIAILLVMEFHFFGMPAFAGPRSAHLLDRGAWVIRNPGWAGVDLFFVLSGFLITGVLLDAKGGAGYFRNFYARRGLRIFPVYYAFLLFVVLAVPHLGNLEEITGTAGVVAHQGWYWSSLYNFGIATSADVGRATFFQAHFWSLAVEEQFYLVLPALVLVLSRRGLAIACAACVVSALVLRVVFVFGPSPFLAGTAGGITPARMDGFAIGGLLAIALRTPGMLERIRGWAGPAGVAAVGVLLLLAVRMHGALAPNRDGVVTIGLTATAFLFGSLLLIALTSDRSGPLARVLAHPVLRMFGKYSYCLYVVHLFIALALAHWIDDAGWIRRVDGYETPARIAFCAVATVVALAVAWVSWQLLESPILRLKRLVPYGRSADGSGQRADVRGRVDAAPATAKEAGA